MVKIKTKLTVSKQLSKSKKEYLLAVLTDTKGNPIKNCNVGFADNGVKYVATGNDGKARYFVNHLKTGKHTIKVAFWGNEKYDATEKIPYSFWIGKIPTTLVASREGDYLIATLKDADNHPLRNLNVGFADNGVKYVKTNTHGEARYSIAHFKYGTFTIKVKFFGNDTYRESSKIEFKFTNEPPKIEPQKSRSEKILDYFESLFGVCKYIDDAIAKLQNRGYAFYFSDGYNMYETIRRVYNYQGANCYDISEVLYHLALGMNTKYGRNYQVQYLDVWCPVSGYDHIRLRLRNGSNGEWFYRDGACVLDGGAITDNWCGTSNNILEVNPSWIIDG